MNRSSTDLVNELEFDLQRSLHPVQPNPEFVNLLHTRLISPSLTIVEPSPTPTLFLLAAAGLGIGFLLIWIIRQLK